MKVNTSYNEQGEKCEQLLEVEISAEEMEEPFNAKVKQYAGRVNIPGFRKGKAPAHVVSSFIGVETLLGEVAEELFGKAYQEAIKEHGFIPIAPPKLDVVKLEKGQPVTVKAAIPVRPKLTLGQYKGLEVVKKAYKITDYDIDIEMEKSRERVAKLVDLPSGAQVKEGHIATIDFAGYLNDEKFEGGSAENYPLEIGSGSFIPGFEEQLIGMTQEEERDIKVTFPKSYGQPKLAGEEVVFKIKLKSIRERQLPQINDDFVKDVSETANTVAEWRDELRLVLQADADAKSEDGLKNTILTAAIDNCEVKIPFLMTEPRVAKMYDDITERLEQQGYTLQQYLESMNTDIRGLRQQYRTQVELDIKCEMMLGEIAKQENIEYTEAEVEEEVRRLAEQNYHGYEDYNRKIRENDQIEYVYDKVRMDKAVNLIMDAAVVTVEEYDAEAMLAEQKVADEAREKAWAEAAKTAAKTKETPETSEVAEAAEATESADAAKTKKKTKKTDKKSE